MTDTELGVECSECECSERDWYWTRSGMFWSKRVGSSVRIFVPFYAESSAHEQPSIQSHRNSHSLDHPTVPRHNSDSLRKGTKEKAQPEFLVSPTPTHFNLSCHKPPQQDLMQRVPQPTKYSSLFEVTWERPQRLCIFLPSSIPSSSFGQRTMHCHPSGGRKWRTAPCAPCGQRRRMHRPMRGLSGSLHNSQAAVPPPPMLEVPGQTPLPP